MSRFFVSKVHIDVLMTAAVQWPDGFGGPFSYLWRTAPEPARLRNVVDRDTAGTVGTMLWQANWDMAAGGDSPEDLEELGWPTERPTYEFEELPGTPDPIVVIRALDCYEYQTGDEPHYWWDTEAYAFLQTLRPAAIHRLPGLREQLDALPWEITDREIFLRRSG
jgi:hypothetical protein